MFNSKIKFSKQHDSMDCGPACLRMLLSYYGVHVRYSAITKHLKNTGLGVSLNDLSKIAVKYGFISKGFLVEVSELYDQKLYPAIIHWNNNHFVVLYKIKKNKFYVLDPAFGQIKYSKKEFCERWVSLKYDKGYILTLHPNNDGKSLKIEQKKNYLKILNHLKPFYLLFLQILFGLFLLSVIQFALPIIMQIIVDIGISQKSSSIIILLLMAQVGLFLSKILIDFIREYTLLNIGNNINIKLVSNFLITLLNIDLRFFENKKIGDLIQRISDNKRIEFFLTKQSIRIIVAITNLTVFGIIFAIYNSLMFLIYFVFSVLYFFWIFLFMKKRKEIDKKNFEVSSSRQNIIINTLKGVKDIKINNLFYFFNLKWINIQRSFFKVQMKSFFLQKMQSMGGMFITQLKNIIITYLSVIYVIEGKFSIGTLMAVQTLLAYLNSPIESILNFFHTYQDASLSIERLDEIHENSTDCDITKNIKSKDLFKGAVRLINVDFSYPTSNFRINNLSLNIPDSKVTAIIGESGCGKTTILNLLLGLYIPIQGDLLVGETAISKKNIATWRNSCSVVFSDSYLFENSVAFNITLKESNYDKEKMYYVTKLVNLDQTIQRMDNKFDTVIGYNTPNLSKGQIQRLLIARALYKDVKYYFFDEPFNALDIKNEEIINNIIKSELRGKTVVLITHKLKMAKNSDKIILLDQGRSVENGHHNFLIKKSHYYKSLYELQKEN